MIRLIGGCLLLFVGAGGLYASSLYQKADEVITQVGTAEQVPKEEAAQTKPLTILLMGTDYREETQSMNTDVMMGIALNPKTKSATVVSLPRDLEMEPEGFRAHKANFFYPHFYAENKETAFGKSKDLYGEFFGLPFDYMVTIDFEGFVKAIDELGGLTLDVDMDMRYVDEADGTNIDLKQGTQLLSGKETLDFIRYRKSNRGTEESSDYERNRRQQQVLDAIVGKLGTVDGAAKLGQLLEAVGSEMKTDIPADQIKNMIKTYYSIKRENIKYMPLEGEWVSPFVEVEENKLQEARDALRKEAGLPVSSVEEKNEGPGKTGETGDSDSSRTEGPAVERTDAPERTGTWIEEDTGSDSREPDGPDSSRAGDAEDSVYRESTDTDLSSQPGEEIGSPDDSSDLSPSLESGISR
ncbi:transcriptional regulator [Paenibacillus sp. J31TS4]|uniref:LCP family protein n=1 Tax=Paenibacillus sp. J31TS4 TaxID=2807195 RepID=UPI001B050E50|nr:LCP family protein [Paenibacillus sp. J31TS4]GIP36990.1 transcriptional regulator [Paenibacillus sp. J31TS4]